MKAVGAIAIAYPAMITAPVIGAADIIFEALLLVFAGLVLCPLVRGLKGNAESFVALLITGIPPAAPDMAWAFGIGIAVDLFIRKMRIKI